MGESSLWHYDFSDVTVALLLEEPQEGGQFEFVDRLRDETPDVGPNYEGVQAVLERRHPRLATFARGQGTLTVFRGVSSLHQVSPPVELEGRQWAILQLTGIKAAKESPLSEVQLAIQNALLTERRAEARERFIKELRGKAAIEIDQSALDALPKPKAPDKAALPDVPKPKLNPALFHRRLNPTLTKRPGQEGPQLKLEQNKTRLPQKVRERYLGPGQGGTEEPKSTQGTP